MDRLRRAQGEALDRAGFGPAECALRITAAGQLWRLRDYGGRHERPAVLIVAAPIKRPYIWNLAPATSAVRACQHLAVLVGPLAHARIWPEIVAWLDARS